MTGRSQSAGLAAMWDWLRPCLVRLGAWQLGEPVYDDEGGVTTVLRCPSLEAYLDLKRDLETLKRIALMELGAEREGLLDALARAPASPLAIDLMGDWTPPRAHRQDA